MWPRSIVYLRALSHRAPFPICLWAWLVFSASGCRHDCVVAPSGPTDESALARISPPPGATEQVEALVSTGPAARLEPPVADNPAAPVEFAATVPTYTLQEAIAIALRENPRLRVAAEAIERARGQSDVAFSAFLPELDLFSRYGGTSATLSPGAPGPVGAILPAGDGGHKYAQAELDLQWTVWDFGRRAGGYGRAQTRERSAALQLIRARQTVVFDVTAAYLGLLQAQSLSAIQKQAIRRAKTLLEDARSRRAAGVAERDDVLRSELLLAEANDASVGAGQDEYNAVARLNFTMGRNPGLPLRVVPRDAVPVFEQSLDDCLRTAAVRREEIAVARESMAGAEFGLKSAEAEYLPFVFVRLGVGHVDGEGVRTGLHEGAAIHLNQTLYAGGRLNGERDSARADVRAAAAAADVVLDSIALEVHIAYRQVTASADRIRLSEAAVAQAAEYLRLIRVRYKNGDASPVDIVDAETADTRADLRYQTAVYEHLAALARLEYALGTGTDAKPIK